jgi:hypothetical protein
VEIGEEREKLTWAQGQRERKEKSKTLWREGRKSFLLTGKTGKALQVKEASTRALSLHAWSWIEFKGRVN